MKTQERFFHSKNTMQNIFIVCLVILFASCDAQKKDKLNNEPYTNNLISETSPYLLQHSHNPVNWNAWNASTLAEAKKEKKLIVISIGYAACHWCHVMEHESFEDTTVAGVMNKYFINIKVDREERPDIDQIYINAVTLMTGSAGWPLNIIALPDGRPVYGGTYFRKQDWIDALGQIQKIYENNPSKLYEYADKLEEGIKSMDLVELNNQDVDFENFDTKKLLASWSEGFDYNYGGYNRAPKFMMPNNYEFLLREAVSNQDEKLLDYVNLTLKKMAFGGLYDQIGGGFARYSTDVKWHVPHFEKMLYDNAQLVSLYSHAYAQTKNPLYKEIIYETLEFIKREMTNKLGAFYSSLDADSENEKGKLEEGAYYVYSKEALETVLKDDFPIFKAYYNINTFGKWEDNYVLIRTDNDLEIAKEFAIPLKTLQKKKAAWKEILLAYRNNRPKPRLDDKSLTSWNALMLKGYIDAYKAFGEEAFLEAALKNAEFIKNVQLQKDGSLNHNYKEGKSSINGYLEDYSSTIEAFISLYEVTMDSSWLLLSKKLTEYTLDHFFDDDSKMFYFTSNEDPKLVTRTFEFRDNVIPASNSVMANNLFKLSHYFEETTYNETAHQMLKNVFPEIEKYPSGFSNWLNLLENYKSNFYEVVVVGVDAKDLLKNINTNYLPNVVIAGSEAAENMPLLQNRYISGETLIYVCENNSCKLPVNTAKKAIESINRKEN